MSAMYRLKAYFGMVPAEEMGDYAEETVADRYAESRRSVREQVEDRWDDSYSNDSYDGEPDSEDWERRPVRSAASERSREPSRVGAGVGSSGGASSSGSSGGSSGIGATRGALAMDSDPVREPARPLSVSSALPEQRDRVGAAALARITTLQPRSYNEARTIGERYRDGQPVIMNLTDLDDAAAKRLVDFAAGLAFALRGSIDKVTNRVFLLTPADVEVSADDARKLAERSVSGARIDSEKTVGAVRPRADRGTARGRVEDRGIFRQD
jgi:cell division inhibitor SepF